MSYNYLHRYLNIISWLISTSFFLNLLLGSSTVVFIVYSDLDWGRGLLSFIWVLWLCVAMGNMDGEMDSEGNACVQTLPDTNWVPALLSNYGIIFPLSFTTRVWKGWEGGGPDPAFLHPILFFITFSPPPSPPHWFGGWVDIWHLRLECCLSFPKYIH